MARVVTDDSHYKKMAETIRRQSVSMDGVLIKPADMPGLVDQICEDSYHTGYNKGYPEGEEAGRAAGYADGAAEGKQSEYNRLWDAFQHNGSRVAYTNAFYNWRLDADLFKPKYTFAPTVSSGMFHLSELPGKDAESIDVIRMEEEGEPVFDFSACANMASAFRTNVFKTLSVIDLSSATNIDYCFYLGDKTYIGGAQLTRIDRLISAEKTNFTNSVFSYQENIEYIGFEGVIAKTVVNLKWSAKLNEQSIIKLFGVLSGAAVGGSVSLSKTAVNTAFETAAGAADGASSTQWAALVNTKSNWTINLV